MNRNPLSNRAIVLFLFGVLPVLFSGCRGTSSSPQPGSAVSPTRMYSSQPAESGSTGIPPLEDKPRTPSKLETIEFHSDALGTKKKLKVYLPPGYDAAANYPVLYLLHGYFGTESAWMPEMGLNLEADRLIAEGSIDPLIIVAPEMNNSYGLNSADAYRVAEPKDPARSRYYGRYEDYLVSDVLSYVDGHYSTIRSKEGRYIGGFSMGGFISLHAAFRHPDLFSKAGGHSPALWLDDWSRVPLMKSWLYPTKALRKKRDPVELAQTQELSGLSVYLDCGDQDDFKLYEGAGKLYGILQTRGVASEFHLNPGNHSRNYWKNHIEEYLMFYAGKS